MWSESMSKFPAYERVRKEINTKYLILPIYKIICIISMYTTNDNHFLRGAAKIVGGGRGGSILLNFLLFIPTAIKLEGWRELRK